MSHHVVVVESPAKAKTINKYLGKDYTVLASYGHIRDLPAKNGSVDPDNNFDMIWHMEERSQKHVSAIAKAMKNADTLYLATDPDREGEAISWHVLSVLKDLNVVKKTPVQRIVFNEITKTAVQSSIASARAIDMALVDAYLARRALDYLVGFTLSPVLWRKLPGAKSAGRVQSVALRLIVDREIEIEKFITQEYWSLIGQFLPDNNKQTFEGRLSYVNREKLEKFSITNAQQATTIQQQLVNLAYHVENLEKKQVKRNPAPPFITSTLQQEASRKLGFSASRTMQIAQKLYEGIEVAGETLGLITYMRTDSTHMAKDAINEARTYLEKTYGAAYVPKTPRVFKTKSKNAQEAHECIRPTRFALSPTQVAPYLDDGQRKLYDLIWKRALSSQMEQALFDQVSVDIQDESKTHTFRATGSTQVFDGFLKLYQEGQDEPGDDDDTKTLPILTKGQAVSLQKLDPLQHFTQPPPRYSEASLVKKLEELGIGRPSTYAPLLHVIQDRNYVRLEKRQFIPEDRGRIVTSFLMHYFPRYVEYDFTAQLEEALDEVSEGNRSWHTVMKDFWVDFKKTVEHASALTITNVIDALEEDLTFFLFQSDDPKARICPQCHNGTLNLKLSKFGAFVGCSVYPDCKYTRPLVVVEGGAENAHDNEERPMGEDPTTHIPIVLKKGPYGYYFEWQGIPEAEPTFTKKGKKKADPKPKRISLPADVLPQNATLEIALKLAIFPKHIGSHPEDSLPISVAYGRFGPYVKHNNLFASIPKTIDYNVITLDQAVDLIEKKKLKPPRPGGKKKGLFTKKTKAPPAKTV